MADQEFIETLNGIYFITAEGKANCTQVRVNIIKNIKNGKTRFFEELPVGDVGDIINIKNVQVKTSKCTKRKILNIYYRSLMIYPEEENDLFEHVDIEELGKMTLNEFKEYPNNSGLIKLKKADTMLKTRNTTACAVIGKGVNIGFRPSKRDGNSHLVIDVLSDKVRYNIIGWNFIETKNESINIIPVSNEYVFFNVKINVLNNKNFFNLDNTTVILYKFCDEYLKDIKNITGKWNELQFIDLRWYNKTKAMVEYGTLEEALEHIRTHINSPVVISIGDVIFDPDKWKTRLFTRHTVCGNVTPYSKGIECKKCHDYLEHDNNWWLLTTTAIELHGKRYYVKVNDMAYIKLLNQIDLGVLGEDIVEFTSFSHFKKTVQENPIDDINELEEQYVDFMEDKSVSIRLKVINNGKGDAWAISYEVMDIIFNPKPEEI